MLGRIIQESLSFPGYMDAQAVSSFSVIPSIPVSNRVELKEEVVPTFTSTSRGWRLLMTKPGMISVTSWGTISSSSYISGSSALGPFSGTRCWMSAQHSSQHFHHLISLRWFFQGCSLDVIPVGYLFFFIAR